MFGGLLTLCQLESDFLKLSVFGVEGLQVAG